MIKRQILQEDISILNVQAPNNRVSKHEKQKVTELQGEKDEPTIIVGDSNTSLSEINRSSRQRISKDIVEFNRTINQPDTIYIYRLLHPTTAECIFFSIPHGTFTKMDHILGHKTHIKFKRIEIIQCLLLDHSRIKLEINNRKITGKAPNTWRLNNTLLNNT